MNLMMWSKAGLKGLVFIAGFVIGQLCGILNISPADRAAVPEEEKEVPRPSLARPHGHGLREVSGVAQAIFQMAAENSRTIILPSYIFVVPLL